MAGYKLLIDGELVGGDDRMDVINPASETLLAVCPRASEAQLNQAVVAAKYAFPDWSAKSVDERGALVAAIADVIEANASTLARLLTQEQGKPLAEATREINGAVAYFRYFADLDLPLEVLEDSDRRRVEVHRKPLGVVGAIVPWNFPISLMAFKLPPALIAGNTIVLKPAPTTPLTTLYLGELIKDLVPAGVVNVITGDNDLGAALTSNPDIAKISFTGSSPTGVKVMAGAANSLKRITLELGGNDAAVVLDDVKPKEAARKLFGSAFINSGQICIGIKRLFVHDSIYDEVVDELSALANGTVIGDGLKQGTTLGPLQNRMQYERLKTLIEDSKQNGTITAGGEIPDHPGYFIRPTIVRDISEGARIVDEEQFGPVLPVIRYFEEKDAIERANNSEYGLGGSIWSSNIKRAYALAEQMDAGTVWINKHAELDPGIPFGGMKQSGIGRELGQEGLQEFTQLKIINVAK